MRGKRKKREEWRERGEERREREGIEEGEGRERAKRRVSSV